MKPWVCMWKTTMNSNSETAQLRLGLEPRWTGLKSGQNPDWGFNWQCCNWDHTWSQDLTKLRFLTSHFRKSSVQFSSVAQSSPALCNPMNRSTPGAASPTPGVHSDSRPSTQKEFSERQRDRWEVDFFRGKHTPQTECGLSEKVRMAPGYGVVSFYRSG